MVLSFTSDFLVFGLIAILLNIVADLFSRKLLHLQGVDLLFFAPWIAGIKFGIYDGIILAVVLLIIHSLVNMRVAKYIFFSFPAQIIAVIMGYLFGLEGFWVTLVVYYLTSTVITGVSGGLGARYFMFLLANILMNIGLFFAYRVLF